MKIICIGRNYSEHTQELDNTLPKRPMIFLKPESAICEESYLQLPKFSNEIHYECEWILRFNADITADNKEQGISSIDLMSLGIDFTARDLQSELKKSGHPWEIAKAFDRSAFIGEWRPFRQADHLFELKINGETAQKAHTNQMIFDLQEIIEETTKYFTINKGDILFTGTPSGVGCTYSGNLFQAYLNDEEVLSFEVE